MPYQVRALCSARNMEQAVQRLWQGLWLLAALALTACGGGSTPPSSDASATSKTLTVELVDVLARPVEGATVILTVGSSQRSAVSAANGVATFDSVPFGAYSLTAKADGFEQLSVDGIWSLGSEGWRLSLTRIGAWAIGPAIILGTRMIDRSANRDSLVFTVDVAVITGEVPESLETLTASDFSLEYFDCGWGGPRDCASDADGDAALGYGSYGFDGPAKSFALHPGANRRPYLVGVAAQRSGDGSDWNIKGPALKSYFGGKNGADAVGLASVQVERGATTFNVLGPFASDGSPYLGAIDGLSSPAGAQPSIAQVLPDAIRWTAATTDFPGNEATLLWLSTGGSISLAERNEAVALARQSGLHFSAVTGSWDGLELGELAMLTGGFVARIEDLRQYGSVIGVMDRVLSGTLPYYRIEYRLTGEAGLFSPGGNVRLYMRIDVPTAFGTQPVRTQFDVAIPLE